MEPRKAGKTPESHTSSSKAQKANSSGCAQRISLAPAEKQKKTKNKTNKTPLQLGVRVDSRTEVLGISGVLPAVVGVTFGKVVQPTFGWIGGEMSRIFF